MDKRCQRQSPHWPNHRFATQNCWKINLWNWIWHCQNWIGGFNNSLRYKGFSLSALVDISQGVWFIQKVCVKNWTMVTSKRPFPWRWYLCGRRYCRTKKCWWYLDRHRPAKYQTSKSTRLLERNSTWQRQYVVRRNSERCKLYDVAWGNFQLSVTIVNYEENAFPQCELVLMGVTCFISNVIPTATHQMQSAVGISTSSLGIESTSLPMMRYFFGVSLNVEL